MNTRLRRVLGAIAVVAVPITLLATVPGSGAGAKPPSLPIVIGHRGASGYRPEHTLAAYRLAAEMGADYIEPDVVSTSDGVLVARHENEISGTTDVADHPEFADRFTTKVIDGVSLSGWFTEDFTLAELKTLRAKERIAPIRPANTAFDGLYEIPTLDEVIDLAKDLGVGLYPETKHPSYFDSIGLSLEEPLVASLRAGGLNRAKSPVFVQSFEVANLEDLNRMTPVRLVQLIGTPGARPYDFVLSGDPRTYADLLTPAGLAEVDEYADGVGPPKELVVSRDLEPSTLVDDAHAAGLVVHPYTFRRENPFLPPAFKEGNPASPAFVTAAGDLPAELRVFYDTGIDGVFTDNPDVAVATRVDHLGG